MTWCPTRWGWLVIFTLLAAPVAVWWLYGEDLLSITRREPSSSVLMIEAWIGIDALQAAAQEFKTGNYQYVVSTGTMTYDRWSERHWSYADLAAEQLRKAGLPKDKLIVAYAKPVHRQRTYEAAIAAWDSLRVAGIQARAVNVFTIGAHAARSRLVFAKCAPPSSKVGVIAWVPPDHDAEPWWRSSERGEDLMKETVGFFYEALLSSGHSWAHR